MGQLQDDYFERVMGYLGYTQKAKKAFLFIDSNITASEDAGGVYPTNNRITALRAHSRLIAYTYEERNDSNHVYYSLVCTLSQEVLDILRANPELLEQRS